MRSEGYGTYLLLWVCVSVRSSVTTTTRNVTRQRNSDTNRFIATLASNGDFDVLAWKASEQANMQISTAGLTSTASARCLCVLKAQEVTTKGVYRLSDAIYYCS